MRRVVVTGLGLVTPLGTGVEHSWTGIVEGRSGIRPITAFDTEGYGCTIAGEVPSVDGRGGGGAKGGQPVLTLSQWGLLWEPLPCDGSLRCWIKRRVAIIFWGLVAEPLCTPLPRVNCLPD